MLNQLIDNLFIKISSLHNHDNELQSQVINLLIKFNTMTLFEKINNKSYTFYITKINDDDYVKLFLSYCVLYSLDKTINNPVVGIDFEFTNNYIQLIQICFFPKSDQRFVFVVNPLIMHNIHKDIMIKSLFISSIKKIVHGADSLDIPYIFNDLFIENTDYLLKFTMSSIDTRFLCEYHKISSKYIDNKCSLYNALVFYNVITKNKMNQLEQLTSDIPIYKMSWRLDKISSNSLKYAVYDVVYLEAFYQNIYASSDGDKLELVNQINNFIIYNKYDISQLTNITYDFIHSKRNYKIKNGDQIVPILTIYVSVIDALNLSIDIKHLLQINNFKKTLSIIFKGIVYSLFTEQVPKFYLTIFHELQVLGLHRFLKYSKEFSESIIKNILIE